MWVGVWRVRAYYVLRTNIKVSEFKKNDWAISDRIVDVMRIRTPSCSYYNSG